MNLIHPDLVQTTQADKDKWRAQAMDLGVNPNEPDDFVFHCAMARCKAVLDLFKHHAPSAEQIQRISNVREGAMEFAKVIMRNVTVQSAHPWGAEDYGQVMRLIHEAMMTANKSIVNEKL